MNVNDENQVLNLIELLSLKERSAVSNLIFAAKRQHYLSSIEHCYGDQKALFNIVDGLMHKSRMPALPQHDSPKDLADQFMDFF